MTRSKLVSVLVVALGLVSVTQVANAQEELVIPSNEPQKGRLANKSSKQTFKIVVSEDNSVLRFRLRSETGNLQVEVVGADKRKIGSWQAKMDSTLEPKPKLSKGTYYITVSAYSKTPGVGLFALTILSPKLHDEQPAAPRPAAAKEDRDEELRKLRDEVQVLRKEIERLRKLLNEKDPGKQLKDD